jgi:beta-lactamase class A
VLHQVELGKLQLDQPVRFLKSDRSETFSPLQQEFPEADVDVPLRKIIMLTVETSDNTAADIQLRLIGGPAVLQEYLDSLGLSAIHQQDSEHTLHGDQKLQYRDYAEPAAMVALLRLFADHSPLNAEHTALLNGWMLEATSGPKRIKGLLPADTSVAHKTGSSGVEWGTIPATNDVGLITLPDGRRLALAVFVVDAHADQDVCEHVIAAVAKAVYDETLTQQPPIPVGAIDFYGYGGIDVDKLRGTLPVHVGDTFTSYEAERAMSPKIKEAILKVTGRPAVAVANVAVEGQYLIYIGLSGTTMKKFPLNPQPQGSVKLPQQLVDVYNKQMELLPKAIAAGESEDDSNGYDLSSFPELHGKQLEMRQLALQHGELIRDVLKNASDAQQRIVASDALGYAKQDRAQIEGLVLACHDSIGLVRNNATRALGVLASAHAKASFEIPAEPFIEMLSSESWTDRNKAGFLLEAITASRNPKVLAELRSEALEPLIEMAKWHASGHAGVYRIILGRIGGIDEARLQEMTEKSDQVEALVAAARNAR